jgi:hypothetical protein
MSAPDNKVEVIQLGNSHKYYYNPNWASGVDISVTAPYLETFNF